MTATTDGVDDTVLEVSGLTVTFPGDDGAVRAVRGVDYRLRRGEVLGIVGESGSGKSVTSLAVMGLLPGTPVRLIKKIPLNGPVEIKVRDFYLSLRRKDAQNILVKK